VQAVRKLLVASQKGGVGKTTTSINVAAATALAGARVLLLDADPLSSISSSLKLAEHTQRQSLRQVGIDLPGVLVSNVLPGLDVLSPYEDGGCSDDDLDALLALLAAPAFQECYGCLVVDTPPFLGANPPQLLATCDEYILVLRAEPLAARTLPAFLELVQRSSGDKIRMRGILLTLPEGEEMGGRWEREMRGRFGTRILGTVIPHDEAVSQAVLFGQIITQSNKESPAAAAYHHLVESLELAGDARETIERTSAASALLLASAALKTTARRPARVVPAAKSAPAPAKPEPVPVNPREKPVAPVGVNSASLNGVHSEPVAPIPTVPAIVQERPCTSAARAAHEQAPTPRKAPAQPAGKPAPNGGFPAGVGLLWIGLAMVVGVALRFLHLPEHLMPFIVGIGVAVLVVVVLRPFSNQQDGNRQAAPTRKPPQRRPDPGKRLSGLKRRVVVPGRNTREK
jgi:chromosome partitioning protein